MMGEGAPDKAMNEIDDLIDNDNGDGGQGGERICGGQQAVVGAMW